MMVVECKYKWHGLWRKDVGGSWADRNLNRKFPFKLNPGDTVTINVALNDIVGRRLFPEDETIDRVLQIEHSQSSRYFEYKFRAEMT
jgi:hypothetical protein